MDNLIITVQDLSKEDSILKVIIGAEDSFHSFKKEVAKYLFMDTEDFNLYSQNTFLDDTVKPKSMPDIVYAIPKSRKIREYTSVSAGSQKKVSIEQLGRVIESRALDYARGIKAKNQNLHMERKQPISLMI